MLLCFMIFPSLCALASGPFLKHYTVDHGVPSSGVYQIIQGKRGYIWLATDKGIGRFNGQEFKKFTTADGLPENTVFWMNEDQENNIWLNHVSKTISVIKDGRVGVYEHQDVLDLWLGDDLINLMHADESGNLWIGISTSQHEKSSIACISPNGTITELEESASCNVSIKSFSDGSYIIGVQGSLAKSHHEIQMFDHDEQFAIEFGSNPSKTQRATSFCKLGNGVSAISAGSEILLVSNKKVVARQFVGEATNSLIYDSQGDLWVGLVGGGALRLNSVDLAIEARILTEYVTTSICQDHEGGYWFSTLENGIFYSSNIHLKMFTTKDGLPNTRFSDLVNRNDTLWVGGLEGRLSILHKSEVLRWTKTGRFIGHLAQLDGGTINVFGSATDLEPWAFPNTQKRCYALSSTSDAEGNIWLGGVHGVHKIEKGAREDVNVDSVFNKRVDAVALYHDTLWAGSVDGLYALTKQGFQEPKGVHKTSGTRIKRIGVVQGFLAIATRSHGILMYKEGRSSILDESNGLQSNLVNDMCILNDTIWLASDKGISAVWKNEKTTNWTVRNYSTNHGLPTSEIENILVLPTGIWFTCHKGLGYLPGRRFSKPFSPILYLTSVSFMGNDTSLSPSYSVPYYQNRLEVSYEIVSFRWSGHRQYKYRFSPISDNWVTTNQNTLQFNSLAPDDYQFFIKTSPQQGIENDKMVRLAITIQKAIWQTYAFRFSVFLLVVFLLLLMYKWNLNRIRKNHLLEREFERMANKAMISQMNPHFIYNSLNTIQSFIARNDNKSSMKYVAKFSRLMRRTFQNSTREFISLEEEFAALKLFVDLENHRRQRSIEIEIIADTEVEFSTIMVPPLLFQPFVENAIIHGILPSLSEQGKILVKLKRDKQKFTVLVQNNGIPITTESKLKLLQFSKSRKVYEFDTTPGHGLTLTLNRIMAFNERNAPEMPLNLEIDNGLDENGTSFTFNLCVQIGTKQTV